MNMQKSLARINELMSVFVAEVKGSTAMNWTDINLIAENVLIPLFSEIYGHTELKNLNTSENPNFPAIDLGDKTTRIAYQITSTPTSKKIKSTLKKFVDNELYNEYDHLIIYILTEKQNSYQGRGFTEIIDGKFTFDKDNDIRDYQDLLREISNFPMEKLQKIEELLEQQFGAKNQENDPQDITEWIESVNKYWRDEESSSKIKIDRGEVRQELYSFASQDNGVVIGSPGVGKTYLLKKLLHQLNSEDIPHLFLPIDLLGDSNPEVWPDGFSFRGDLIDALKSIPIPDKKGIIVFDGFDAARDERKRKNFLILIQRAIQELDNWNVIVTVRTYDAKKSQELLALFKGPNESDQTKYQIEEILCRHFSIAPFSQEEILHALNQIGYPETIYLEGSDEFRSILSNPFNIWVLENILKFSSHEDIRTISKIRSEVQLLDRFWEQRIENENSERVLRRISSKMVENRSLIVKIDDIYDNVDLDNPERRIAWDKLQSDEILSKTSSTRQQLAFSHNILFDYAISVLHIEDDSKELEAFLEIDQARALFLRPSLTYFFTRLWYYKPDSFWQAFWHILPKDQSVHLRLVARLIPPSVIANEARNETDLEPLMQKLQNKEPIAEEAVTRLMQSLQNLQIKREIPWIHFHDEVSQHLHDNFAWDLANLTTDILEKTTDSNVKKACGRIGRRLLKWVWQEREKNEDDWINRFGGRWAVPLVAKTFHTKINKSRALLVKVLQLTKEENFPIGFLSWLTDNVDSIWLSDPDFVVDIYRTVFGHIETSKEERNMGGYVLPMTSFRAQDYSMCQYRLVKHFPNFLRAKPLDAARAAIQSLNVFIVRENVIQFLREDVTLDDMVETFNFRGKTAYYIEDSSYIWDARESSDEPIEMADTIFKFIEELATSEESHTLLESLLDIFRENVVVAFFWKRLLLLGSQFPTVFASRLFELCIAKPIQLHSECFYELGLFIKSASSEFNSKQLFQIEESILEYPIDITDDEEHRDILERKRNKLLAQIPLELLQTKRAKQIREDMDQENSLPENRPLVSFTFGSETVTEEKWLKDKGVDTTTPENQILKSFSDSLEDFITEWRNKKPAKEDAELIVSKLREVHENIKGKTNTDDELINTLWRKITEGTAILVRISNDLDENSFDLCRSILLEGASHKLPDPDQENDENFDFPGYSSQVRHYAAEGLLRICVHKPVPETLSTIEVLADDKVPSVRMITAMHLSNLYNKEPDRFWHIICNRADHEENPIVQECLYSALTYVIRPTKENDENTARVMAKILKKTPLPQQKMGSFDPFSFLISGLAIVRQNQWALKKINDEFLKEPIKFANLLSRLVTQIIEGYVDPKHIQNSDFHIYLKRAITLLKSILTATIFALNELGATLKVQRTEKTEEELRNTYSIIDKVITRLYFLFAYEKDNKNENTVGNTNIDALSLIFNKVHPLMQQIVDFAKDNENGLMFAPTAHYFMQLLTNFLNCDHKSVIILADGVAKSSERFGYNLDAIAVKDIVDFVEIVLADYRKEVREDDECLESLLNLLDLFAKTGQSEALNLVWRLDEVFR